MLKTHLSIYPYTIIPLYLKHFYEKTVKLRHNKIYIIYLAIFLMLINLIPIWICKYFPSQNGPEYLLAIHMVREFFNPSFNYSDFYELEFLIVPNLLYHVIIYLLSFIVPLLIADKIAISLNIILFPLSVFYFISSVDSKKVIIGLVSFTFIYNYFLLKGYSSFYFSITVFFFFFGYLIRHFENNSIKNLIWLSILGIILYLSHVFSFVLAILAITIYTLVHQQGDKKWIKLSIIFMPALILLLQFIFYMVGQSNNLVGSTDSWIRYDPYYTSAIKNMVQTFIKFSMYAYTETTVLIFYIPLFFIFYLLIKKLANLCYDNNGFLVIKETLKRETMLILFIFLLLLFIIFPTEIAGWPKFNTRLLPFIFVFILACIEPFSKKIMNRVLIGTVSIATILICILMASHIIKINKVLEEYNSGISVIEKNKTLLPIQLENYHIGKIDPLQWAFNYYNIFKGGATDRSVVIYAGRVPLRYKQSFKAQLPEFAPSLLFSIEKKFQDALDAGNIPQDLWVEFKNRGYSLSEDSELRIENKGSEWQILDDVCQKTYAMKISKDKIDINSYPLEDSIMIAKIKKAYDYILFWGNNHIIFDRYEKNGFKLIHQNNRLRIYSNLDGEKTTHVVTIQP